jgi:hypothetical protein
MMQRIPDDATPQEVRKGVVTEIANVEADPAVKALAPSYRTEVDLYINFYSQIEPLEDEWILAEALLKVLDRDLDTVIKNFRLDLISRSGNKLTGPLFDTYLPDGLRAVTEAEKAKAEPEAVRKMIEKATSEGGELAEKWVPLMKAALAPVVAQAAVRHGIERRQETLEEQIDKQIITLQETRVVLHGQLRGHFKSVPDLAEDYFHTWRSRRKARAGNRTPPRNEGSS